MAPRLNKRQLREAAELVELGAASTVRADSDDAESEGDEVESVQKQSGSIFDVLNAGNDAPESEEEDEDEAAVVQIKKSKNKKKKKSKAATPSQTTSDVTPISGTPSKRATKAAITKADLEKESMDEIDRALAELETKDKTSGGSSAGTSGVGVEVRSTGRLLPKWQAVKDVYAFDPKFLDPDAELRKMFGSKVIKTTAVVTPQSRHHARLSNNKHHAVSLRRTPSYLATPEAGWSPPSGILTLTRYEGPESLAGDGDWYTFQHSGQYRQAQLGFMEVLQQADGNRLHNVLAGNPYHVDTLMQLSEMMVQQGDLGASSSYLSKALYALSTPLPSTFISGNFRLPYSQIENRAFFLGAARKVAILVKRGTWRTACEWCKIALGVGGDADPVGMLLFIDFLAPKSGQNSWFLSTLDALSNAYPQMRIENYPGLAYAKALCIRGLEEENSEDSTKSSTALRSAILKFPMVVSLLYSTLGGSLPPKLVSHRRAQVDGTFTDEPSYLLSLLSTMYSVRSAPLWKDPPLLAWLQKTVAATAGSLDDSTEEDVRIGEKLFTEGPWPKGVAPSGVIRAAFTAEIPSVRPYLPPSALSGTSYSYDPLPPARNSGSGATFYDDAYFAPLYGNARTAPRSSSGVPQQRGNAPAAGMMDAFRNQLAALMGMGGEGGMAMTDDLRAELLADLRAAQEGDGALPGGFPGAEDDDDYESDDDEVE